MRHPDPRPRTPSPIPESVTAEPPACERALRVLTRLTLGDALGIPTQSMSPTQIRRCYGRIAGLRDTVAEQPITPSVPAGNITDDTEQTLTLAGLLIDGNDHINPRQPAGTLLRWEDDICIRRSLDLLGPPIKLALKWVRIGADPHYTEKEGITNGTAMRMTPVGIAFSLSTNGDTLIWAVQTSCLIAHDTRQGFKTARLFVTAVSTATDSIDTTGTLEVALDFMAAYSKAGHRTEKASVATRTRLALETGRDLHGEALAKHLCTYMGTSVGSAESIPYALMIVREFAQRPLDGLCFVVEFGGNIDIITAMASAAPGANAPHLPPVGLADRMPERSDLRLEPACGALLALRDGGCCQ